MRMPMSVPVVLIAFRRPHHTSRVLEAIRGEAPQRLYIVADGPRAGNVEDELMCAETREVLTNIDWDCEVTRIYADSNMGLKERVVSGLDLVFEREEFAVILEDDCVPNRDFFRFCSFALNEHFYDANVALVSGNNFFPKLKDSNKYFFINQANIWGWATWRRTWNSFRESGFLSGIPDSEKSAILDGIQIKAERKRFAGMLGVLSDLDSWAIPFACHVYRNKLLCATPGMNLVTNVGMGVDSTHTKFESYVDEIPVGDLSWPIFPPDVIEADLIRSREISRHRSYRWVTYPLLHPIDFLKRAMRYLKYLLGS